MKSGPPAPLGGGARAAPEVAAPTLHGCVAQAAVRAPDAVAVSAGGAALTFEELERRANQLAHRLQVLGVGPDTLVAIGLERTSLLVVGLLGILKAGGAYLPLDASYPRERVEFMLADAGSPTLIHDTSDENTLYVLMPMRV